MKSARIYQPARNAMQSGRGKTRQWVLEFLPEKEKTIDPLMGWTGSSETSPQVRLGFPDKEAAIQYAEKHKIAFELIESLPRQFNVRAGGYGENFSYTRRGLWTH